MINPNNSVHLELWKNYLRKDLFMAPSMIIPQLNNIVYDIVKQKRNSKNKDTLNTIADFYDVCAKYIDNTDSIYKSSVFSEPESETVCYIINLIVTPSILTNIYQYIQKIFMKMVLDNKLDTGELQKSIIESSLDGYTIKKYLTEKLPRIIYKKISDNYSGQTDPDRGYTEYDDIFEPLVNIIQQNKLIYLIDTSTLVTGFKTDMIPFLKTTYRQIVHHILLANYGYQRYILNMAGICKMVNLLY